MRVAPSGLRVFNGERRVMNRVMMFGIALACCVVAAPAAAQGWKPEQNVEISVGTAPGGGTIAMRYLNSHPGNGNFLQMYSPNVLAGYITGQVSINYNEVTPIATLY